MNTKKTRLLSILFAFALSMIGIDAFAWDIAVKNSDGITIFYNWLNATDLEVAQGSYSGNVVIPEKVTYNGNTFSVTRIGAYAFSNRTSLTSVTIPKSVTSIGIAAFDGCSGLTSVNITDIAAWCRISFDLTGSDMPNYLANPLYFAHHLYLNGEEIKNLEIPSSVNSIGRMVFYGCNEIVSVTIPNSVTTIGFDAFHDCSGLTSVNIPNSVTSIGGYAFSGCSGLASIKVESGNSKYDSRNNCNAIIHTESNVLITGCKNTFIPNSVTSIGDYAFQGHDGLTSVTIPNSVTSIGKRAFNRCTNLTSVTVEMGTPLSIDAYTFSNRANATLYVPAGYKATYLVADYWKEFKKIVEMEDTSPAITFADANVKSLCVLKWDTNGDGELSEAEARVVTQLGSLFSNKTITSFNELKYFKGLTSIENGAFNNCSYLTSVTIPDAVTSIGGSAFNSCSSLTSVTIPNSVNSIGYQAFRHCRGLTSVTIGNSVTSIGHEAFYNCRSLTSVTIPNSVTSIGNAAFQGCSGLTSVTIGNSVTSIGKNAFSGCMNLTSVNITDIAAWCNISFDVIMDQNTVFSNSANPLEYAGHLYLNGKEIKDLVIPNSVTSIGNCTFVCSGLTSVTIPNSVTSIGNAAFQGCSGLTSVTIGNSVTSIGKNAFYGCMNLTSVNITDIAAWCNISFDVIMDQSTVFTNGANPLEYAGHLYLNGKEIKDLVIPSSVTSIGDYTFSCCRGLTSVTIPNSVTSIGIAAFQGCMSPTSITIPNSVTSIGNAAFQGCISLTSITIPNSVTSIGRCAFDSCEKLTSVTIPNSVTSIEGGVFQGCTNLTSVTIPNSVTSIEEFAFALCIGLTSVTIPSSVTSIGEYAFYMTNLTEIYSMNSDPFEVNSNCWYNVNKEIPLYVPVGSKEKYLATAGWNEFNIIELGVSTNNTLAMDNLIGYVGRTITLPILMNNEQQITGLQFDICLPEGVTVAKKANGKSDIMVTERMEEGYSLSSNTMEDGSVRVTGLSGESIPFTGNSGAIVNVVLQVDESIAEGDYQIQVKNIILSDVSGVAHKPTTASCTLTIKSYILGDVDDSGDININDAVCIVNYILNKPNAKFIPEAADLDGSGDININDAVVLINKYILKRANAKAMKAPRRAATGTDNYLSLGAISIKPGETKTVSVDMTNTEGIQGLQCSIDLPEGLSFATKSNGKIDIANNTDRGDGFTLSTSLQEDGSLTVATVNFEGDSYYGNSGTIFTFKIKADENMAAGEYEIKVCDIVLSSGVAIKPSDAIGKVTVEGSSSGLQQIDADGNQSNSIYNLNGQRVKKPNHGVYIHNGRKVIVE